jgi:hypothetical protein
MKGARVLRGTYNGEIGSSLLMLRSTGRERFPASPDYPR